MQRESSLRRHACIPIHSVLYHDCRRNASAPSVHNGVSAANDNSQDSKLKGVWERVESLGPQKVGYGPDFATTRTIFLNMYVGSYPNAKFQAWINFVGICWRFSGRGEADPRIILLAEAGMKVVSSVTTIRNGCARPERLGGTSGTGDHCGKSEARKLHTRITGITLVDMKRAGYIKFRENSAVVVISSTLQEYMIGRITRYHAGRTEAKDIYPYQKSSANLFVIDLR